MFDETMTVREALETRAIQGLEYALDPMVTYSDDWQELGNIGLSGMRTPFDHETPELYAVRDTGWSDYSGSVYTRSNHRVLPTLTDEPLVEVHGDYAYSGWALESDKEYPTHLLEAIAGLVDYPVLDEDDHARLESELVGEAVELETYKLDEAQVAQVWDYVRTAYERSAIAFESATSAYVVGLDEFVRELRDEAA